MSKKSLKITGAELRRPAPPVQAQPGAPAAAPPLEIAIALENPADQPRHVWSAPRAYDYEAASGVLALYLTELAPPPPPGIEIISDHPRTPPQVVIDAHGRMTLKVALAPTIRRLVPSSGLGMSFVEEPIGPVSRVELHVQFAAEPFGPSQSGESPEQFRQRLRQHGEIARATITFTEPKE
jgi:hypothetical protein